jgi:hypothetical protein
MTRPVLVVSGIGRRALNILATGFADSRDTVQSVPCCDCCRWLPGALLRAPLLSPLCCLERPALMLRL